MAFDYDKLEGAPKAETRRHDFQPSGARRQSCTKCGIHRVLNPATTDKRKPYTYWYADGTQHDVAGRCYI